MTLYELSRLPEPVLHEALAQGRISPEMRRKDVVKLLLPTASDGISPVPDRTCSVSDLHRLIDSGMKFGTLYADPPWKYGNQATRSATGNHYPTMTPEEIAALPIGELVCENAQLHLWTTNGFLFESKAVMEAWGFAYKSAFVWVKPRLGIGNYWRVSHEFLLLGVRGRCPFRDRAQRSWLEEERTLHSAKPESIRRMIERVSPSPYLELFGRRLAQGWTVWGNQIERSLFDGKVMELAHAAGV
jgi:N6-adenosine-specific RNA methylase IME4